MEALAAFDEACAATLAGLRTPGADRLLVTVTRLGDWWVLLAVTLALTVLLARLGRRAHAWFVAGSVWLGVLPVVQGLKCVIGRARPPLETLVEAPTCASLPSGHAFGSLLVALFVGWTLRVLDVGTPAGRRLITAAVVALALVVGVSRAYVGVHWATDVISGWALASLWFVAAVRMAAKRLAQASPGDA